MSEKRIETLADAFVMQRVSHLTFADSNGEKFQIVGTFHTPSFIIENTRTGEREHIGIHSFRAMSLKAMEPETSE